MYYDRGLTLSHNKFLNFVQSLRGIGKTFNYKDWCISDFIKNGSQFVWSRRYDTEMESDMLNPFFDDIRDKYPNHDLEVKNRIPFINGKQAGFFIPLSISAKYKSVAFPFVNKHILDEFVILDTTTSHYIKHEPELHLEFLYTIFRKRFGCRSVLLANNISTVNPYYLHYNIKPDKSKRFTTWNDGSIREQILIDMYYDAEYVQEVYDTPQGKLVKGTKYGNYAIENQSLRDDNTFIEKRSSEAQFMLYVKYNDNTYGFWVDYNRGLIYTSLQFDPSTRNAYCLQMDDHSPNLLLIKSLTNNKPMQRIVFAFDNGLLRFDSQVIKNQVYEFMQFFRR